MQRNDYFVNPLKGPTKHTDAPEQIFPEKIAEPVKEAESFWGGIKNFVSEYKTLIICIVILIVLIIIAWVVNKYTTQKEPVKPTDNTPKPEPKKPDEETPQPKNDVKESDKIKGGENPDIEDPQIDLHDEIVMTIDDEEFDRYINNKEESIDLGIHDNDIPPTTIEEVKDEPDFPFTPLDSSEDSE